jgi:hypothetical protein
MDQFKPLKTNMIPNSANSVVIPSFITLFIVSYPFSLGANSSLFQPRAKPVADLQPMQFYRPAYQTRPDSSLNPRYDEQASGARKQYEFFTDGALNTI